MKIQEFINSIPKVILQRGQDYFDNGYIMELTHDDEEGTWYAEVEGNYGDYQVEIEVDENQNVGNHDCDCPYDGAICKHVAAVALAIKEENSIENTVEQEPMESWKELVQNAEPEELRDFILELGKKNKDVKHRIKLAFSKPASVQNLNNISYYRTQINQIYEHHSDRGFIGYREGINATQEVESFMTKADDYFSKGNLNEAFCISAAVAMESVEAIQNMDDSSGSCGGVIYEAFHQVEEVFDQTDSFELKDKVLTWLYEQVQNSDYDDYGVGDDLEPLFFKVAKAQNQLDIAYKFIDKQIILADAKDGWNKKYNLQKYLRFKTDLLKSEGKSDELNLILDSYLHLEDFRKAKVAQALAKNEVEKAEKLIIDGIKIAEKENYAGIVHDWKDQLLALYQKQRDQDKVQKMARELFVDNFSDLKYFRLFKQTCPKEKWEEQRNKLITELKNKKRGHFIGIPRNNLANIYVEEHMTDELFELVSSSNDIHTIIRYTKDLQAKYPAELVEYYKAAIEITARLTGRPVYQELVKYLKLLANLKGGLPVAKALKNSLLETYKNRRAMKEEFAKLGWD